MAVAGHKDGFLPHAGARQLQRRSAGHQGSRLPAVLHPLILVAMVRYLLLSAIRILPHLQKMSSAHGIAVVVHAMLTCMLDQGVGSLPSRAVAEVYAVLQGVIRDGVATPH